MASIAKQFSKSFKYHQGIMDSIFSEVYLCAMWIM